MTTQESADEKPEQTPVPAPAPEPAAAEKPAKEAKEAKEQPRSGLPLGHIVLGGASATTLGGFWLASAVGPWAVAGVGAGAVAAGGAYVHHRIAKKRGQSGQMTRTVKTQTNRSGGGALGRMGLGGARRGGLGSSGSAAGGRGQRRGSSAGSTGTRGTASGASKRGGTAAGAGSARPASGSGSSSRGAGVFGRGSGGRGSGARPLGGTRRSGGSGGSGSSGRGLLGRRSGGSSGSSGRGLLGRRGGSGSTPGSKGRTSRKGMGRRHSTPPGDGGMPPASGSKRSRTRMGRGRTSRKGEKGGGAVGATPKTSPRGGTTSGRWGGASGSSGTSKSGRIRAMGRRAAGWADGRTGNRASTAWKAASGTRGFRARRRAAKEALRHRANHHRVATPAFALVGAVLASLWTWQGRIRQAQQTRAQRAMDNVDPDTTTEHAAHSSPIGSEDDPYCQEHIRPYPVVTDPTLPTEYVTSRMPASEVPVGGNTMAGLPHAQHAADMRAAAGRYEPTDIFEAIEEARYWTDAVDDFAESVRAYARRMHSARFPFHSDVYDALEELYAAIAKARPAAENIEPTMRSRNSSDVDRNENPRGDEMKANVSR